MKKHQVIKLDPESGMYWCYTYFDDILVGVNCNDCGHDAGYHLYLHGGIQPCAPARLRMGQDRPE